MSGMPRADCAWPASPSSVRSARAFAERHLTSWGADDHVWSTLTVVSELATNAVLHARTEFSLSMELSDQELRLEVRDGSVSPPVVRRYSAESATGRGLQLLDELTSDWGSLPESGGKVVWCVVRPVDLAPPGSADDADVEELLARYADA